MMYLKKIMIFNFLIVMGAQIQTAQVAVTALQTVIDALQSNVVSLNALSAVTAKVPSSTVAGLQFYVGFNSAENKFLWARPYILPAGSVAAINQTVQSEGGVYIVITPISQLTNWRASYAVYGAKSFNLVDAQTMDLNFNTSNKPVPTNQVKQLTFFNISCQLQANGAFTGLPVNVPINQATLLQFTAA